jgi:hypothetical protein
MRVVREFSDEVCGDAHDDDRGRPMQSVVDDYGWAVHTIRTNRRTAVVICAIVASHVAQFGTTNMRSVMRYYQSGRGFV